MADSPEHRPLSKQTRTSLVDTGWSDEPPLAEGDSTVQISRDELEKLVTVAPGSDAPPRELPRYEASDDGASDNEAAHPDDATKRISYAALLGGSQAGRGGPRRAEVHELPTLIAHKPLTEEVARVLALEAVPSLDDEAVEFDEPLPSFEQASFDKFEEAAATFASPFGSAPDAAAPPTRRKLDSNPLPVLGFDDSDVTVRAVIEVPGEPPATTVPAPPTTLAAPATTVPAPVTTLTAPVTVAAPAPASTAPAPVLSLVAPTEPAAMAPVAGAAPPMVPRAPVVIPQQPAPAALHPLSHTVESAHAQPFRASAPPPAVPWPAAAALALDEPPREPPGVFEALGQRCSILGLRVPLAALWLIPTALAGAALAVFVTEPGATPAPAVQSAQPPPEASAVPVAEPTLRERVIRGDSGAYETLKRTPEGQRTVADTLALAQGRAHVELRSLDQLKRELEAGKANVSDEATRERLLGFVTDSRTAPAALAVVAALRGPSGPDLLYEIWTGTKRSNETTQLARELLYKPEIRGRASEALAVALDLRSDPECEEIPAILPRAEAHADWRSLHLLGKLLVVRGCGAQGYRDCYPCLRNGQYEEQIGETIKAARRRARPKP